MHIARPHRFARKRASRMPFTAGAEPRRDNTRRERTRVLRRAVITCAMILFQRNLD